MSATTLTKKYSHAQKKAEIRKRFGRTISFIAENRWCSGCIGTAIATDTKLLKEGFPVAITPVNCEWYDSGLSRCAGCCEKNHSCSQPPALLQEAAAQLSDWVNLLVELCDEKNPGGEPEDGDDERFAFLREERRQLVGIANDLRIAYQHLEQTHRSAHQIGNSKRASWKTESKYKKLVIRRRALALKQYPRPPDRFPLTATRSSALSASNQAFNDLQAWQNHHKFLGLLPEDEGYVGWQMALHGAVTMVHNLLEEGTYDANQVAAYERRFPHLGDDI